MLADHDIVDNVIPAANDVSDCVMLIINPKVTVNIACLFDVRDREIE